MAWARGDCAGAEAPKPTHPEGILQRLRGKGSQCEGANSEFGFRKTGANSNFEIQNPKFRKSFCLTLDRKKSKLAKLS